MDPKKKLKLMVIISYLDFGGGSVLLLPSLDVGGRQRLDDGQLLLLLGAQVGKVAA